MCHWHPEAEEKLLGQKVKFEEIMTEIFPKLDKNANLKIQQPQPQQTPNKLKENHA